MIEQYTKVLAPLFALLVAYLFFYQGFLYKLGSEGKSWAMIRSFLPYIDEEARDNGFYTSYTIGESEYVGTVDLKHEDVVSYLRMEGFINNPLAAHKDNWLGQNEVASLGHYGTHGSKIKKWGRAKRFIKMAFQIERQHHVTLFEDDQGRTIVTAHYEYSPYNVFRAFQHFRGKGYDVDAGVKMAAEDFADHPKFQPSVKVEQMNGETSDSTSEPVNQSSS